MSGNKHDDQVDALAVALTSELVNPSLVLRILRDLPFWVWIPWSELRMWYYARRSQRAQRRCRALPGTAPLWKRMDASRAQRNWQHRERLYLDACLARLERWKR